MNNTKTYLSLFLIFTMILSSITVFYVSAAQATDETDVAVISNEVFVIEQELVPAMANACGSIPQRAYSMYSYIVSGNDPSIYTYHEYENTSYPYLPRNTTYVTYYMTGSARLVIGADGSAYYSPDHYSSWMKMY